MVTMTTAYVILFVCARARVSVRLCDCVRVHAGAVMMKLIKRHDDTGAETTHVYAIIA